MRPISGVHEFVDILRCLVCGAAVFEPGPHTASLMCRAGHRLPVRDGMLDTVVVEAPAHLSVGRRVMQFTPFTAVYERWWRPAFTAFAGLTDPRREAAALAASLELGAGAASATLLDVACGPGNTTRSLAAATRAARVVGVDFSAPMLREAVAAGRPDAVGGELTYVRADAAHLPLADAVVDGAQCAAALYLFDDPVAVLCEIARVLRPGSRLAGMTFRPASPFGFDPGSALTGVHFTRPDVLRRMLAAAGFGRVSVRSRGLALTFCAIRP